jgi:pimeloyl-ACP methyl ester carboxylesterase
LKNKSHQAAFKCAKSKPRIKYQIIPDLIMMNPNNQPMRNSENEMEIVVNNFNISYMDEGAEDAMLIIFIHGFPYNKSMWYNQLHVLKQHYRVIAYDVRGSTDINEADFSIDLFVHDLLSFMDALKIEKAMLCGYSMGGYIALNAIENYPDRFNALILSSVNCITYPSELKEKRLKAIKTILKNSAICNTKERKEKDLLPAVHISKSQKVTEEIQIKSRQLLCAVLAEYSRRKETCSKLIKIKIPVLIIFGKEDKKTPTESVEFIHENIAGSFLTFIDHAGQTSNMENPDQFNRQLMGFVSSIGM